MFNWKILPAASVFLFCLIGYSVESFGFTQSNLPAVETEKSQNQSGKIPADLLITLERTACYGNCPAYKLTVKANGSVLFESENSENKAVKFKKRISKSKVTQLVKEFEKADYFSLSGKYDTKNCYQMTDNPSASTSILIDGKQKKIEHYQGCRQGTDDFKKELSKLTELENKIDEIVGTKSWIDK